MTLLSDKRRRERMGAIEAIIAERGIAHFSADELVRHTHAEWPWDELYPPPTRIAHHIGDTLELADRIRSGWGSPVRVTSGYRCPPYNDLVGGSPTSQHIHFHALDLQPVEPAREDYRTWCEHVRTVVTRRREDGLVCGLGLYRSFVHIDTGYYEQDRDWSRR